MLFAVSGMVSCTGQSMQKQRQRLVKSVIYVIANITSAVMFSSYETQQTFIHIIFRHHRRHSPSPTLPASLQPIRVLAPFMREEQPRCYFFFSSTTLFSLLTADTLPLSAAAGAFGCDALGFLSRGSCFFVSTFAATCSLSLRLSASILS